MLFNRAIRALWLLVVPFSPVAKGQQQPELDITKVGLRPRSEVIKVLGPPSSVAAEDQDGYAWGFVGYTNGRLDQIDYQFKARATSVGQALEKVGLTQTSTPHQGPLSYYWNSSTGPLVCCGFEMDNVVIPSDFSGISVGFKQLAGASNLMSPTKVHKERSAGEIEIDFTKMALQTRARVTQTLGPPKREQKPEGAVFRYSFYQWGFAYYEQGRLKAFEYKYKRTPSNINDALEKVGLKQTSQPREDLFIIILEREVRPTCMLWI